MRQLGWLIWAGVIALVIIVIPLLFSSIGSALVMSGMIVMGWMFLRPVLGGSDK